MGLNLVLYNLAGAEPQRDRRFDSLRHTEDYSFAHWLNAGNATYRLIGNAKQWSSLAHSIQPAETYRHPGDASRWSNLDDSIWSLEANEVSVMVWVNEHSQAFGEGLRHLFGGEIYERPKDIAAARVWVRSHAEPGFEDVDWDRDRLMGLLDLLESDEHLWLYQSW